MTVGITSLVLSSFTGITYAEKNLEKEDVIVVFKNKDKSNKKLIVKNSGDVNMEYKNIPAVSAELTDAAISNLKRNPNVLSVEPDRKVKVLNGTKDTGEKPVVILSQTEDWGLTSVKAKEAWDKGITGSGVKVAVLDTGIEHYHTDLNIAGGVSFVTDYFEEGSSDSSYDDYHGHGTHVAGTIGAKNNSYGTVGVAPNSQIYAVKVMDSSGEGMLSDVIAGIDWSITNKMDVINLSIGSPSGSNVYHEAFKKAQDNGIIVFAASGNDNEEDSSGVDYPAIYPETIAVAAIDSNHKHASFSSKGNEVDVAAPGVRVISTYLNGQYAYMSGTSMATPYVAGMAALYKETYPNLSVEEIINKMLNETLDIEGVGKDDKTGRGLIQYSGANLPDDYNKKITIFDTYNLYRQASDSAKTSYVVSPQTLQAYKKQGSFIEINTWMGKMFIKPTLYLEGEKVVTTKKVTLTQTTLLYDLPFDSYKRKEVLNPQKVYTIEEINGWYVVQTWLGYKFMKPTNPVVEDYIEQVKLSYREELLEKPDAKYKTGATLNPQTVTTLDKRGDYYLIKTWLGNRWIKPKYPIVGQVVPTIDKITLTQKQDLYELPFSTMKTGASISEGQVVQAVEKWNGWTLIKTWLGNKWIRQ